MYCLVRSKKFLRMFLSGCGHAGHSTTRHRGGSRRHAVAPRRRQSRTKEYWRWRGSVRDIGPRPELACWSHCQVSIPYFHLRS